MTLFIVIRASRNNKTAADYYAAGRSFTGPQNGFAISGDYLSAASFLGITGAIAINGYDGFLYSIGFLVAWLVALLLVAELMRNTGKFTMADVLSFRLKQRSGAHGRGDHDPRGVLLLSARADGRCGRARLAAARHQRPARAVDRGRRRRRAHDRLRAHRRDEGHDLGADRQGVPAHRRRARHDDLGARDQRLQPQHAARERRRCIDDATRRTRSSGPGLQYGENPWDFISLAIALVLGTAGLPHVLMRFYTVPTAKEARRSVVWAIWLIGIFYLLTLVLGYGAASLVGPEKIMAAPGRRELRRTAARAARSGGPILLGFISAVAFATILAVVAGLTITAAASFAHDIYANVVKKGNVPPDGEVKVARRTVVVIGVLAIIGGIGVQGQNIAFLVALAFAVAASANLPTILYSLFWRRFTTRGAVWSMYGGLAAAVILIFLSPVFWGTETSVFKDTGPAIWPLNNPGIVSIPLGFFLGWLGSVVVAARAENRRWPPRWTCARSPASAPRRRRTTRPAAERCAARADPSPGPRGARTAYSSARLSSRPARGR